MSKLSKWFFRITIIVAALFFQACYDTKNTKKTENTENKLDTVFNCEITDKSKLEDITMFLPNHPFNTDISAAQVDPRSDEIMNLIRAPKIHPDFGSGLWEGGTIGIPFIVVCKDQSKFPIVFRASDTGGNYGNESDKGPYPIPLNAPIEGSGLGGDQHVLAVDIDNMVLYELYNASVNKEKGNWEASSGAIWDLKINDTRPAGWTSADASGMPILPLLVRYDEVLKGVIDHPIRFTLTKAKTTRGYTAPASHWSAGDNKNINAPTPYGMRLRLKANFNITAYSPTNQVILTAMKKYGLIFADIGSDFFISGAPDERWDNDDLRQLKKITSDNFEVIKMGTIVTPK